MSAMTIEQILRAVGQLSTEERETLLERLQTIRQTRANSILDDIPIIDVGPWPENLSLRREEMYGDDQR